MFTNIKLIAAGVALAALLSTGTALYVKGRMDANHKQQVAALMEERRFLGQVIETHEKALKADDERAVKDAETITKYEEQIDALSISVENPDRECLSHADTKRLLDAWDLFSEGKPPTNSSK